MNNLNTNWFPAQVPPKPSGYYAHIVMLRVTESYPLFQTDGELNTARVSAGVANSQVITRLTMFKRKQTTPERLVGRELLRHYGLISPEFTDSSDKRTEDEHGLPLDEYNVRFCQWTPDAIAYGYAIGDSGSERSKVLSDTCYSLTPYDDSHEAFTLNAPYESGTMSQRGEVTSRINEQDHIVPQVIFPCVLTTRDLTWPLFRYVLNNVLRTRKRRVPGTWKITSLRWP
jgi:CRISPR-associated protein Csc2